MEPVVTVGQITHAIAGMLGEAFPHVVVRGQISNLRRPGSGHVYFSLKDDDAQLACAMWRSNAGRLRFQPEHGQEVVATGHIDVYPPRGSYQLIVRDLAPLGVGELHLRFEALKKQLHGEGLFAPERKQSLPLLPRRVAVVTSRSTAALQDLLRIARRRMPACWVTLFPARVQGQGAADEVAAALDLLPSVGEFDVVIVTRGGGSLEDLWAFNEEVVARAIARCPVPVVSAVGHEIDTTIADLVADARAATPSEAAELVFPDTEELVARVQDGRARLGRAVTDRIRREREHLHALERTHALARPADLLQRAAQDLDEWERRGADALSRRVATARDRLSRTAGHLSAVSPLAVLDRGYAIATRDGARAPLRDAASVTVGDSVDVRLARGRLRATVTDTVLGTESESEGSPS